MSKWHNSIIAFHKIDNADDPDSLVLGSPATAASVTEFEKEIGYTMPDEFKELYSEHDGFGTFRVSVRRGAVGKDWQGWRMAAKNAG